MRKKAFTLIELIAVLVILAILALIVTPLVMNIIRKARIAADKRSIDAYGRSVELSVASYLLETGAFPTNLGTLKVEYIGSTISCNVMIMKENGGIYLSECTVNNKDVKDSSTDDGWYHYGTRDLTNEEYVDMYGDALKTASLEYYMANNQAVLDYTTLTIDYNGKKVSCDVTVNYDGTIYMTNCKVNNVSVTSQTEEDGYYHYGKLKKYIYNIGDEVTYNNVDFYVIENSGLYSDTVVLLKAEPLTVDEINENKGDISLQYGVTNNNGYGGVQYYYSQNCYYQGGPQTSSGNGCTTDYNLSNVKIIVDNWSSKIEGIQSARLITEDELMNNLEFSNNKYDWVTSSNYWYWTMTSKNSNRMLIVSTSFQNWSVFEYNGTVRPVITIKKSVLNE